VKYNYSARIYVYNRGTRTILKNSKMESVSAKYHHSSQNRATNPTMLIGGVLIHHFKYSYFWYAKCFCH